MHKNTKLPPKMREEVYRRWVGGQSQRGVADEYIAERHKNDLGKVSVGKSCIRLKKIEDINLKALERVIKLAAKSPGLV